MTQNILQIEIFTSWWFERKVEEISKIIVHISGNHECPYKIEWQSIQWLLRLISLDQHGGQK